MDVNDIPQDNIKSYGGHYKVMYAQNKGKYQKAITSGWDDEYFVTEQAVALLDTLATDALQKVRANESSPIFYYMYLYRYDLATLAQETGFFQWQIKRHFKPAIFVKLSEKKLAKYMNAFNLDLDNVRKVD